MLLGSHQDLQIFELLAFPQNVLPTAKNFKKFKILKKSNILNKLKSFKNFDNFKYFNSQKPQQLKKSN